MTAKFQETQKRRACKDLLKLREHIASSSSMSSSAQSSADLETSSLVQELSGVYRRLDEAKQQIVGLQNEQAQLFAQSEAKAQSAAMATAEVVTLKQELAEKSEHAQALAADLASAEEASLQLTTSAESQAWRAQEDLLLRPDIASSDNMRFVAQRSADVQKDSLELEAFTHGNNLVVKSSRKEQNQQLEDVTAFLEEANSNNAALELELESAHRQHSELYSKLTLKTEYLQRDLELEQREGDAARRSLRDLKDAQVQALHAQSAAFEQTLKDAKTVAAQVLPLSPGQLPLLSRLASFADKVTSSRQPNIGLFELLNGSNYPDILKFAAALDESKHKESEFVQRLQRCQLELHQQTAALRGEVVHSRNKHMQCAQRLQDAEEELEQVHQVTAKLEQQVSSLTAALEDSKQKAGLTAHKLSQCEQQFQMVSKLLEVAIQEVAALQVKVHEANSRASGAATSLGDALDREHDLSEHLSQKQANEARLLGELHDLANQLAAAQAKEQDLVEKLACKHANQQKLQAQVCSLASQLNKALASPHQGLGSQLRQLQKEVLRLTDKIAEQQSKTAQAEAVATLMQISADLTQKVSDASPRPASPLVAFSPYSLLAFANSTSPPEAASLSSDNWTHVTPSELPGAHALGSLSPLTPVSPAVGLSPTALMAPSSMTHCSPLVRPSAPSLRALPSVSPASSLHASAPALRALSSLSFADRSVLQSAPALRALSSLNSAGAVPGSPHARRKLSSVGGWTGFQTPPSIALTHMPSPLQTEATTPSSGPSFNPAEAQLLSSAVAHALVQSQELVLPDLNPPPPLIQSDALIDSTNQIWTSACSRLLSAAQLNGCGPTGASAGLSLTGGTSSSLRCSPGSATNRPSPARPVLSSSPVASLAAPKPGIPVRQTKKQKAMMDCVAKKLVTAMPGLSSSVSLNNAAAHSPEGMSVHNASLQKKSRMSVSKAGGRSPFGDMTNNIDLTPNRLPKLPQGDSKSRAGSRFNIGDRPLAATMSNPSTAANRRLSMPTIAGSAQQGQENTPSPFHPARQTILGNDSPDSSRRSSCRVRNSSDMRSFPSFTTYRNMRFPTGQLETRVPKMSPGAIGVTMGMVIKEAVTGVSIRRNRADAAVITMGLDVGSPVSPPSLIESTCRDLDAVGMLCGSPANPSSVSRNALGSAAQSIAPSGASLSSGTGILQPANEIAADSFHSSVQEGGKSDANAATEGRAKKPAPGVPLAVKTRNQVAQEKHLHRMQLRSGAMPGQSASSRARPKGTRL
ncbi:TPA: hypothetical protein ACH3X1_009601 [Trebouxia sp. C0004]